MTVAPRIDARTGHLNIRERTDLEQGIVGVHVEAVDGVWGLACSQHRPRADHRAKKVVGDGAGRGACHRRGQCHRAMGIVKDQDRRADRHAGAVDQRPGSVIAEVGTDDLIDHLQAAGR